MKNMLRMLASFAPSFDLATEAGGGGMWGGGLHHSMVTTDAAPATQPTATPAPATQPATETKPVETSSTPTPATEGEKFQVKDDDTGQVLGEFNSQEEANAFAAKEKEKAAATADAKPQPATPPTDTDALPRVIFGRFKTGREVEDALFRSQEEGKRLFNETKTLKEAHQKDLETRDIQVKQLQAELEEARTQSGFKELSKEELNALWKENPSEAAAYMQAKDRRERASEDRKARIEQETKDQAELESRITSENRKAQDYLRSHPEEFPGYDELRPVINSIIESTRYGYAGGKSPFTGHRDSPALLFYAAKGIQAVKLELEGKKVAKEAKEQAERKSRADAASTSSPTPSGPTSPARKTEDQKYKESVLASGSTWLNGF